MYLALHSKEITFNFQKGKYHRHFSSVTEKTVQGLILTDLFPCTLPFRVYTRTDQSTIASVVAVRLLECDVS